MAGPTVDIKDLFSVKGIVAVVTGGGSGLGLYTARALDANGAKAVYIVGRRAETLKTAAASCPNGSVIPIVGDVSSKESLTKVADQVRKEQGYVNVIFANAGVMGSTFGKQLSAKENGSKATIADIQNAFLQDGNMEDFTNTLHVNATAVFFTAIAFLDLLEAGNKKGNVSQTSQIIVTTSIAGYNRRSLVSPAYNASKAAANQLVKILSTFFADQGIRVRANGIAPGLYPSEMTDGITKASELYENQTDFKGAVNLPLTRNPAGRTGSEADFAATALYFASRAGAFLNGQITVTDGGSLSILPGTY